jgi:hypothetical protein
VRRVSSGFIAAGGGGFALLFDERNVNGECKYDNGFNETHLVLYKRGLDERYGAGTSDHLEERYRDFHFKGKTTKEWSKKEYEAKIQDLKEKLLCERLFIKLPLYRRNKLSVPPFALGQLRKD